MTRPVIVCATSLAGGEEAFSTIGDVRMLPESAMDAHTIRGADLLITRSKVKVNDHLLAGSKINFYGTATAGIDHVDEAALARHGIAWAAAPGSNANSVAEYVITALAHLACHHNMAWPGRTLGIVGAGHVGRRLAVLAHAIGMNVVLNDPPRFDATGDANYFPLADVLARADVVTLHVPLTSDGPHPTQNMVDADFFAAMKTGAPFINTSRGEVVREEALKAALDRGKVCCCVLDVFQHEPDIDENLVAAASLATPHIAGYSLDARWRGTEMIYQAACQHLGVHPVWRAPGDHAVEPLRAGEWTDLVLSAYDPADDDLRLRSREPAIAMRDHFRTLRERYPVRREFARYTVETRDAQLRACAAALGFGVA